MLAIDYVKDLYKRVNAPYIYGAKQNKKFDKIISVSDIKNLQKIYGKKYIWDSDLLKANRPCCDCSGLVDYQFGLGYNSTMLYFNADKKIAIRHKNGRLNYNAIKKLPLGAILWTNGHVGIFIGYIKSTPYYIAEDGSMYNCRINKLKYSKFKYALLNIKGYDLTYHYPHTFKTVCKCKGYSTPTSSVVVKKFRKNERINVMAHVGTMVLCRRWSLNQNCWIDTKNLTLYK